MQNNSPLSQNKASLLQDFVKINNITMQGVLALFLRFITPLYSTVFLIHFIQYSFYTFLTGLISKKCII